MVSTKLMAAFLCIDTYCLSLILFSNKNNIITNESLMPETVAAEWNTPLRIAPLILAHSAIA
jgi:hypothetical protein